MGCLTSKEVSNESGRESSSKRIKKVSPSPGQPIVHATSAVRTSEIGVRVGSQIRIPTGTVVQGRRSITLGENLPPGLDLVNKEGLKISHMISDLNKTTYRALLPGRFQPIYQVMIGTDSDAGDGAYFDYAGSPLEYLFSNSLHETMWIEDVAEHPIFKDHPMIKEHKIRFMAIAPLWSSDTSFVGAAFVNDVEPHPMSPADVLLLTGLTEVILRDLEHFWLMSQADPDMNETTRGTESSDGAPALASTTASDLQLSGNLREAILLINRNWTCIYGNMTWESMSGYGKQETEGTSFWAFFKEALGVSGANLGFLTDNTPPFTLEGYLQCEDGILIPSKARFVSTELGAKRGDGEEPKVAHFDFKDNKCNLAFVSSDPDLSSTGLLANPKGKASTSGSNGSDNDAAPSTWTVTITLERPRRASLCVGASTSSTDTQVSLDNSGIKVGDITLKYRIGQGGFGVVFAGSRPDGKIVAVKLTQRAAIDPLSIEDGEAQAALERIQNPAARLNGGDDANSDVNFPVGPKSTAQNFKDPFLEALLSVTLNHPNLVRSYEYVLTKEGEDVLGTVEGLVRGAPPAKILGYSPQSVEKTKNKGSFVWLIQEYCDLGTLDRAAITGSFLPTREGSVLLILSTLWDIAQGLIHLHSRNLIHGDLTGNNVLLASSKTPVNGKAYIAKISDFGLTRMSSKTSRNYSTSIFTSTFGTILYMPPELVCDRIMNSRTDSYSFGALIFLMLVGKRPLGDMKEHALLLRFVSRPEFMVEFPPDFEAQADLLQLARDCLQSNYRARPSAAQLANRVASIWQSVGLEAKVGPLQVPESFSAPFSP